ncbi:unnamed protein product [Didymodactylos carnosus]|uniref:Uncharacterized protein n=1 Tax=Didymodactylos carnosus TaxID=1234261 RepID=A0A814T2K9_9BILA|nr:unnamed protein product [Didymodactylos carnosus]CAF1269341.1 unnamed protein product [Didymodactylos carnosus]CAF3917810.1 unnamed protein product [Didymodactylos carnosus]CAF4075042.1 unnamed protein product [Didymodactylos carnosus]
MRRGNSYTHFIVRDTFPLDAFSHLVKMHILKSSFRKKIRKPKDITMINPRYALVQHSKMFWMAEAIKLNPFQTQTFFWMDAGYSRFIPDKAFVKPFPVSSKVDWLVREKKMYVGVARATKKEMDKMTEITLDDAVGTSKSFFEGNMWGGWGEAVYQMATTTLSLFFEALSLNSIDNEQVTMFLAYKKHPSTFAYVKVKNADAGFTYMSTEE